MPELQRVCLQNRRGIPGKLEMIGKRRGTLTSKAIFATVELASRTRQGDRY